MRAWPSSVRACWTGGTGEGWCAGFAFAARATNRRTELDRSSSEEDFAGRATSRLKRGEAPDSANPRDSAVPTTAVRAHR